MLSFFLTCRPSIRADRKAGELIIKTGFLQALSTLFLNLRRVEISLRRRTVTVSRRLAYFFPACTKIDFDDVWYLDYSFAATNVKLGWFISGLDVSKQSEAFTISIVTRDETEHAVCTFKGGYAEGQDWVGEMLGNTDFSFAGGQESESSMMASYLATLLGVTIGKPLEETAEMVVCPKCGHPTAPNRPKCLYCGTAVAESEGEAVRLA